MRIEISQHISTSSSAREVGSRDEALCTSMICSRVPTPSHSNVTFCKGKYTNKLNRPQMYCDGEIIFSPHPSLALECLSQVRPDMPLRGQKSEKEGQPDLKVNATGRHTSTFPGYIDGPGLRDDKCLVSAEPHLKSTEARRSNYKLW